MTKRMWALVALLAVGLAYPAAGVTQDDRRHPEHDRLGGLHPAAVGEAVREADRLHDQREVRRLVRRDGGADALRRRQPVRHGLGLRRREPAPDLRRRRPAGRPEQDPRLQELRQGVPVAAEQHGQRQALRDLAPVGPEHAALQHAEGEAGADVVVLDLQPEVQGRGHGPGQPDPDRRRGALPDEDAAEARDHRSVRARTRRSSTRRSTC